MHLKILSLLLYIRHNTFQIYLFLRRSQTPKCLLLISRTARRFEEVRSEILGGSVGSDPRPPPGTFDTVKAGGGVSDAEVGATLLVGAPPLLRGVPGIPAALGLRARLLPGPLAAPLLPGPLLQGALPPPLGGAHPPAVGGLGAPLRGAPGLQEPLEGAAPPAGRAVPPSGGRALAPPLGGRGVPAPLVLLPPLQGVVGAAGALPPLLRGPPAGPVGRRGPLGRAVSAPLRRPLLGSARPALGLPGSPVPRVVLAGWPAVLPAALGISPGRPLLPRG